MRFLVSVRRVSDGRTDEQTNRVEQLLDLLPPSATRVVKLIQKGCRFNVVDRTIQIVFLERLSEEQILHGIMTSNIPQLSHFLIKALSLNLYLFAVHEIYFQFRGSQKPFVVILF